MRKEPPLQRCLQYCSFATGSSACSRCGLPPRDPRAELPVPAPAAADAAGLVRGGAILRLTALVRRGTSRAEVRGALRSLSGLGVEPDRETVHAAFSHLVSLPEEAGERSGPWTSTS